jgi:sigma-E factor negative regulatory protein RseC
MAEHIGIVIQTEENGLVRVAADRKGACGGCDHRGGGCKSCLTGANKMESEAVNPVGAKVGDLVKLQLTTFNLYSGAALLYMLPVLGVLVGAFMGEWAAGSDGSFGVIGAIAGAFFGLAIGYAFLIAVDRGQGLRRRWMPTITKVVQPGVGLPSGAGSPGRGAACCG